MEKLPEADENDDSALDLDQVLFSLRKDGISGKVRKIAYCCIFHQLCGHLLVLGLEPLFKAWILPQQFASIPGRGQVAMARYIQKCLLKTRLNIAHAEKTDVKNAYGSTRYLLILSILNKLIPSARWILRLLLALSRMSPDGCLIIGGYLDARLFNFLAAFMLRDGMARVKEKRGKRVHLIKAEAAFMDDFGNMGSREADLKMGIKQIEKTAERYGLKLKHGKKTKFLTIKEEKARKNGAKSAARGCPSLDMGGYMVHRTYITIRKAIFLRARRQYLRAWRELKQNGFITKTRAQKVVCYYGYFVNTNARKVRTKLHADKLHATAEETISYHARRKNNANKNGNAGKARGGKS